ncbi:Two-component sensor kinase ycbM [Paenibacillus mucilaginosus 3016]|uniref:histidine kinase n=2 Tax=Paenibacillus mucilaginosus TaxID=61624 RepID=H6NCZ6_9BACL|nr:HAMP domain-containing sensor histidine kinase [Paenibacillus mucilaginosus]AFC29478.1 Two-component sensor kinase ycbM [Paenibacillus mucilaginosus 3016]AFH61656.1 ATPase [Paenibacillus mucilaginosus K02]WFA18185.1 HAMP domain-containing histidine kinase [Paenibacillus mucilaginosus]
MKRNEGLLPLLQLTAAGGLLFTEAGGWGWNGPAGLLRGVLWAVVVTVSLLLLRSSLRYTARLKGLTAELHRVLAGHGGARLLAGGDAVWNEAVFAVNGLIERLAEVQARSIRSEAARKSLLANISHDIRTPLTSMIGYVDALRDGMAPTPGEREEYVAILSRKAYALKRLVDETFHLAKLDADDLPLRPEPLDFAEEAREALISRLPELQKRGIELQVRLPEEGCRITADRLSLQRILSNLLENALRYGGEGGVLGVELAAEDGEYRLQVWDRGPGIPAEELPHIFERSYRGDRSRSSRDGGSGLGLAIARALAEKNGGRLRAESEPGVRTVFMLAFRRAEQP